MQDESQRQPRPFLLGHRRTDLTLDLLRVARRHQLQPIGEADHVRVDGKARLAKPRAENDVRRLTADARDLEKVVHVSRHLAVEQLHQLVARGDDAPRLGAKETGWLDDHLDFGGIRGRQVESRRVAAEQLWGNEVDHLVGGLGGQDRRDQELKRGFEHELGDRRIRLSQALHRQHRARPRPAGQPRELRRFLFLGLRRQEACAPPPRPEHLRRARRAGRWRPS